MSFQLVKITDSRVWAMFFVYTSIVALLVQFLGLPVLFSELHAGNGLLVGGDWVGFHRIAEDLANEIRARGWSAWELRPSGHSPAGIAGAVYAISLSKPYMLVPINAALHATAGLALMRIASAITGDNVSGLFAALPFVLYPSAIAWYAQIGKEGFYFAGVFLCLYGWIILARLSSWQSDLTLPLTGLACLSLGVALMGLVRIYAFQLMEGMGIIFAVGLSVLFIFRGVRGTIKWKSCTAAIVVLFLIPIGLHKLPVEARGTAEFRPPPNEVPYGIMGDPRAGTESSVNEARPQAEIISNSYWRHSTWLPRVIDKSFFRLAVLREGYLSAPLVQRESAGGNIDMHVRLSSASDFLDYLPRATQIGFLTPFPSDWMALGYSPGGSLMRRIAGVEMAGAYLAFVFFPYSLWHYRRRVELWLAVTFGIVMLLIYAYVHPNIGTLYRLRFGFFMLLVGIGILGALTLWRTIHRLLISKFRRH